MTDHDKEHRMTDTAVTPEEVAAQAPDESDDTGYQIDPALDPDLAHDHEHDDEPLEPNCLTAFMVIVQADGSAFATADLSQVTKFVPAREATVADMRRAAHEVVDDVTAMQVSQQTVMLMQQSAQQMAEQQRSAKIAQQLASKGIQVPRR